MEPFVADPDFTLYVGDVREVLRELPDSSVDCVATSPPFYALRDYGVDGQIGLEDTPELWVDALVAVFAECRRVLSPAGTLWIECGDTYASDPNKGGSGTYNGRNGYGEGYARGKRLERGSGRWGYGNATAPGAKAKDLMGTPWMLAKALRDPHYVGRIKNELDRVWLAAMVDAEGCIYIHKRKVGQSNGQGYERKNATYGAGMEISNTSLGIVERVAAITGRGSISSIERGTDKRRRQTLYRWNLRTNECRDVLRELYPYLIAKQQQARIALGCPSSGERAKAAHSGLKSLHRTGLTDVDFPPPASMFEQGWWLRQCIVWAKPNAMPESATDRCTTAHSYVFLLSKSARYHFDAEAIAEPAEWARWGDQTVPKYEGTDTSTGWMQPKTKAELVARGGRTTNGQKPRTDERRGFDNRLEREDGKKNPRSVWTIPTQGYSEAHFATWPEALVERIIKAGCPENGTVLDPFMGSGTTALVARRLGRKSVGIELNPEYAQLAARRLQQLSLLADESAA